jgi:hypothetical protein
MGRQSSAAVSQVARRPLRDVRAFGGLSQRVWAATGKAEELRKAIVDSVRTSTQENTKINLLSTDDLATDERAPRDLRSGLRQLALKIVKRA